MASHMLNGCVQFAAIILRTMRTAMGKLIECQSKLLDCESDSSNTTNSCTRKWHPDGRCCRTKMMFSWEKSSLSSWASPAISGTAAAGYFLNILTWKQKRRVFYPPFKKVQTFEEQTTTTKELVKSSLSLSLVRRKYPLNCLHFFKKGMKYYAPNYPICCQPFSAISPLPGFN